jgi:hypothetical protein
MSFATSRSVQLRACGALGSAEIAQFQDHASQILFRVRGLGLFAMLLVACVGLARPVSATMACSTVEQLSAAADPQKTKAIEDFYSAKYGSGAIRAGKLAEQFYIVSPEPPECKNSVCRYHLFQFGPQGLEEKSAFLASNAIWIVLSPTEVYWDQFKDEYSIAAVRTPDRAYLVFQLPRASGPLVVDAWPADSKLPRCPETAR